MSGVPERIGKYRVLELIGRGGMGSVYKAHDPLLDRMVAIKVMAEGADVGSETRIRFLREAQSAARLNHPNIITIYELGEDQGQIFIAMELLEGEPLSRLIGRVPPLPRRRRLTLMLQMCDGLAFAHQHGVIHRDIKPANIFVLAIGQVKILDFGIARLASSELTRTGLLMGTPTYMSPEQARGRRSDARSDIFSLGVVFYELLSGEKPFLGDDYFEVMEKVRSQDPRPLHDLTPTLPPALIDAVHRMLAKDPDARYQSLEALRADLLMVLDLLPQNAAVDLREAVDRGVAEVTRLHQRLVASVGAVPLMDETAPSVGPLPASEGLEATLRQLESQTERLRALTSTAERLEPVVAQGIAAFERADFNGAITTLESVLREMPQHQRARDYRDRSRLEQMRRWTAQALETPPSGPGLSAMGPTLGPGPERTLPPEQGSSASPRQAAGTPWVVPSGPAPPADRRVPDPVGPRRSRLWLPLLLGSTGLAVALGAYLLVPHWLGLPSARPPSSPQVTLPQAAPPAARPSPEPAPAPPAPESQTGASGPSPPTPSKVQSKATIPAKLTPEQVKLLQDSLTLAQLFQARGDHERALREYRRVLAIDPTNAEARRRVAEVERALKTQR